MGLAPNIYKSEDNSQGNVISKRCNKIMCSYVGDASWQVIRVDPVIKAYLDYRKHLHQDSKSITIKTTRNLASRILAMINTVIAYESGEFSRK